MLFLESPVFLFSAFSPSGVVVTCIDSHVAAVECPPTKNTLTDGSK